MPRPKSYGPRPVDTDRRSNQRSKQISFGFNTVGFHNMNRLIRADPRLANGGILPILPPPADLDITKRTWDVFIRKWRRALHMFDHVFIEGEDDAETTLEATVEAQRCQWRNSQAPAQSRIRYSPDELLAMRNHPNVPTQIPVDEDLRTLLKELPTSPIRLISQLEDDDRRSPAMGSSPKSGAPLSASRVNSPTTSCKRYPGPQGDASFQPPVPPPALV